MLFTKTAVCQQKIKIQRLERLVLMTLQGIGPIRCGKAFSELESANRKLDLIKASNLKYHNS